MRWKCLLCEFRGPGGEQVWGNPRSPAFGGLGFQSVPGRPGRSFGGARAAVQSLALNVPAPQHTWRDCGCLHVPLHPPASDTHLASHLLWGEGGNRSTRAISLVSLSLTAAFSRQALCTCCLPLGATPPLLILLPSCWPHHVAKAASLEASLFPNTDFFFPLGLIPLPLLLPGRWVAVRTCPVCSLLCCHFSPGFVLLSPSFLLLF